MKCIICYVRAKKGVITHTRFCADYARPNHQTKVA